MEQTTQSEVLPPKERKNKREGLLLILVALFGIGGIAVLQFTKKTPVQRSDERSLVQAPGNNANLADPATAAPLQKIPGNLIRVNEQPEAGRPFRFNLANFSQGAVYELETGDGHRKKFVNGILEHTYARPGPYVVTLHAQYDGQEVVLQSVTKQVAQAVEKPAVAPAVDF
ncbi:MAG: hypothetical protein IPL65_16915 [Lewinellaceae bacterium]|nr:hypothetical protein [Lewinellaceae bacterium]